MFEAQEVIRVAAMDDVRLYAELYTWQNSNSNRWMPVAPKDHDLRARLRAEASQDQLDAKGFALECSAKTKNFTLVPEWHTLGKRFQKNKTPRPSCAAIETTASYYNRKRVSVDDQESPPPVVLSVFKPYTPMDFEWRVSYQNSCKRRRVGDESRKGDKSRRIVRFQQPAADAIPFRLGKYPRHHYSCVDMNQKTCSIANKFMMQKLKQQLIDQEEVDKEERDEFYEAYWEKLKALQTRCYEFSDYVDELHGDLDF
jgi:hypothetical protein